MFANIMKSVRFYFSLNCCLFECASVHIFLFCYICERKMGVTFNARHCKRVFSSKNGKSSNKMGRVRVNGKK